MNSLRTDDIIGAVPRIRHMPKNLYRPQGYFNNQSNQGFNQSISGIKNVSRMMDYDANYNGGKWEQSYNENMYGNFPLSQYDPNPFIKPQNRHPIPNTQRSQYNNSRGNDIQKGKSVSEFNNYYDSTQQQLQTTNNQRYLAKDRESQNRSGGEKRRMSLDYESNINKVDRGDSRGGRYDNNDYNQYQQQRDESQTKYRNSRILPKQALVINYQQLKAMNLPQLNNNGNNNINKSANKNPQLKKQQNNNPQRSTNNNNNTVLPPNNNTVLLPQKKSDSENSKREKQKSIFRGIGFNIITNSKYQYNLQTSTPYTSRVKQ